jgi:hypothetical protein
VFKIFKYMLVPAFPDVCNEDVVVCTSNFIVYGVMGASRSSSTAYDATDFHLLISLLLLAQKDALSYIPTDSTGSCWCYESSGRLQMLNELFCKPALKYYIYC